ncbi:40S ribosomal protein [Saguinus oedipus]|uniref:40S ribosomal protein n=1 Tax=Saguinus oedipus TaxID=9490 RepID=A0ABQ9UJC6_SAGOE|nr:40S ribosomal protein [Saguinus oedipus]
MDDIFKRQAWGISRDNWHQHRKTGGRRKPHHKKRSMSWGAPPHPHSPCAGGNKKHRALRLDVRSFSGGSECCPRKVRIISAVYTVSNNELVGTKTLVKNSILLTDSTPYRQWYETQ